MDLLPIGNVVERFYALCLKDSGVLYEDPYVQIGIKADWRSHQGRLVLFLGNKNTAPLASVQALMLAPSHLKLDISEVPENIPPRAQAAKICNNLAMGVCMLGVSEAFVLGQSLGIPADTLTKIINSSSARCWISFEDRLKLVKFMGQAMQEAANAAKSAMVSVIGLDSEKVQLLCDVANEEVDEANKVQI